LALNYAVNGDRPWGYHAANLGIHLLNALLLFGILRRTFQLPTLADRFGRVGVGLPLAIALLWTVHPLQTESVTYVVQRAESQAAMFYLLVLYSAIRGMESRRFLLWYIVALIACFLGVATKETVVTAPLMVLLYDRTFVGGTFRESLRRRWGLYVGLAASWALLGWLVFSTGLLGEFTEAEKPGVWAYACSQPGVILHYLRLSAWPDPLCLEYGWPTADTLVAILPGVLAVGVLLAAAIWGLVRRRAWGFVGIGFFLVLAPTSSVLPLTHVIFEHRIYLSLACVLTLVVVGGYAAGQNLIARGWLSGRAAMVAGVCLLTIVCVAFAVLTIRRNETYRSELAIWQDTLAKVPDSPSAHYNCGSAMERLNRLPEAIDYYEQAIQTIPARASNHHKARVMLAMSHYGCGTVMVRVGRVMEALEHLREAVRLQANYAPAQKALGFALAQAGRPEEAIGHYQEAVRLKPDFAEAQNNLGNALSALGRLPEAIERYQEAIRLKPDCAEAFSNLGNALIRLGRPSEAVEQYEHALQVTPHYATAHYNLSVALSQIGRMHEAVEHGLEAVRLAPDEPHFSRFVAWLLATREPEGDDPTQAVDLAERACTLTGRRDIACVDTLAVAYASAGQFDKAVFTAKEAWQLARTAGQDALAEDIHIRLQLYRDRKPYRESPAKPATARP
jgi:tetratricopeptide (TPR) repeat protein